MTSFSDDQGFGWRRRKEEYDDRRWGIGKTEWGLLRFDLDEEMNAEVSLYITLSRMMARQCINALLICTSFETWAPFAVLKLSQGTHMFVSF